MKSNKLFHCGGRVFNAQVIVIEGCVKKTNKNQMVKNAFAQLSCSNVIFASCKNLNALEQYPCMDRGEQQQEHLHAATLILIRRTCPDHLLAEASA